MENTQVTNYTNNSSIAIFGDGNMLRGAQMLAQSDIIPDVFRGKPANVLIALDVAQRINISPMLVMQNLNIIRGKPSWASQFLIGMINASGRFTSPLQYDIRRDPEGYVVSCSAYATSKNGQKITGPAVTAQMVRGEGWDADTKNKYTGETIPSKWKTMPELMYTYRAAAFFARTVCPDLAMGLYTEYEQRDIAAQDDPDPIQYEDKTETAPPQMAAVPVMESVMDPEPVAVAEPPKPVKELSPKQKLYVRACREVGKDAAAEICTAALEATGIRSEELTDENVEGVIGTMINIILDRRNEERKVEEGTLDVEEPF